MAGYTRIMSEAAEQLGDARPDVVVVQAGVGGLAAAVASWICHEEARPNQGAPTETRQRLIVCEPIAAPCLLETARAGQPVQVTERDTIMTGLCAGRVSSTAWSVIVSTADAFVAIDDRWAELAIAQLARPVDGDSPVVAGASGAAGLGALMAMMEQEGLEPLRSRAGVRNSTVVLLINTEGATDPLLRSRILDRDQATLRERVSDRLKR